MALDYSMYKIVPDAEVSWKYAASNPERICWVEGCGCLGHDITRGGNREIGKIRRRRFCHEHYYALLAVSRGDDPSLGTRSYHPYLRYRLNYCENLDGRLGFVCTTTILKPEKQLDTDHINGIPTDNRPENLQTLCKCCHAFKTDECGDTKTPGRKTLKLEKQELESFIEISKIDRKLRSYMGDDNVVTIRKIG